MQAMQKEAKTMYVGMPRHLIPEHMRRYVPEVGSKKSGEFFGINPQETFDIFNDMFNKNETPTKHNDVLYQKHQFASKFRKVSSAEIKEFEEYQALKERHYIPRPHKAAWWNYRIREAHDRKIFGIIPQRGYAKFENVFNIKT